MRQQLLILENKAHSSQFGGLEGAFGLPDVSCERNA
jgi:hypothetical protein